MPTILQVNVTANWGSTGKIAELIGKAAIDNGWESHIAFGRYANKSESRLINIGGKLNTYSHYFSQRVFDNEGLCSKSATKQLIKEIGQIKPDIIHLHNIHDHYLNYRLLFEYLNKSNIKVIWTFHDFWAVTGHCMHFIGTNCSRYIDGCHDCPMRKIYPKSILDRSSRNWALKKNLFSANNNLTIVAVSQWVGNMLKKSFLRDKPIHVINNGINLNHFKPTYDVGINRLLGDKFVILSVASQWKFDKGLDDYINIANKLDDDEIIVLVGVDDDIISRLPHNIVGIKRTNDMHTLAALYTRADVVTILSSAETFGLTVVEGYACGTPAVVYNNTAPPLLISEKTGYIVENKNYKAALDAIKKIKKIGKNHFSRPCMEIASTLYATNHCTQQYISLYNKLIANQ